jgi:hypothetical protein
MKTKYISFIISYFLVGIIISPVYSQDTINSQNGSGLSSSGTIRAFVMFAEMLNDPLYNSINTSDWPKGQMPLHPEFFLDTILDPNNIQGIITQYYYEASLHKLKIVGDYLDTLMQFDYYNYDRGNAGLEITNYINNRIPGTDFQSAHGYWFNGTAFDQWQFNPLQGGLKLPGMDTKVDLMIIVFRVNSFQNYGENNCGSPLHMNYGPIKGKSSLEYGSISNAYKAKEWIAIRHEIDHSLLGRSDALATAGHCGKSGYRSTIPLQGGYSLLSYEDENLGVLYNGFDRWRLGWKGDKNNYISALDASNQQEISTDLTYEIGAPSHDYILRDFVSTGDAIRIQLPYLKSESSLVRNQYLWLENHQMLNGNLDLHLTSAKGLYAYIQVGYDDLTSFSGGNEQYLTFLQGLGNYDMVYSESSVQINSDRINPFTGYNIMQGLVYNRVDPNIIGATSYFDKIFPDEVLYPTAVIKDGILLQESDFYDGTKPCRGTIYDPITPDHKTGIGTNPSTTPVLTYYMIAGLPDNSPRPYDNRRIYLNGLSFAILENNNGNLKVRINFNDYIVNSDTRWCGPIVLNEKVSLCNATITLDQGLTPTRPVNPIMFNGEKIYADPTIFTANGGSEFAALGTANAIIKNNSAYVNELDGNLIIKDQSVFRVKTGSTLLVKAGSNLKVMGSGKVEIETGGCLCIENGANVTLQDATSQIHTQIDITPGVNTAVLTGNYDCRYNLASTPFSGSGAMNCDLNSLDAYYQNQTLTGTRTYSARNIYAGEKVRTDRATGLAKIGSGANITLNASGDILLDNGFEAPLGCTLLLQ